jgi:hypothetical protein
MASIASAVGLHVLEDAAVTVVTASKLPRTAAVAPTAAVAVPCLLLAATLPAGVFAAAGHCYQPVFTVA